MPLEPGARLGPYEITAAIGEGGMGEVYQARDTELDRDVAIKVLPDDFASDPDRLARFEREAKSLAALNHPNIAQVYGLEGVGSVRPTGQTRPPDQGDGAALSAGDPRPQAPAIVMELVEGPTLADRIEGGAIPLDDALPIARQIAEALEAAHERGIIHRDLKPANIKVKDDGTVKVLDFGLAKAMEPASAADASAGQAAANSPTLTARATQMGMILGTAAYMAPEQAKGRTVDRRADVWAFGVVLFEMLTGRRAFRGEDVSEVLASVLKDTPSLEAVPPATPESIRRLLRRCLAKDPRDRLADMATARLEITDGLSAEPSTATEDRPRGWSRVSVGLALLSVVLAVLLAMSVASRPGTRDDVRGTLRFPLVDDPNLRVTTSTTTPFATSRDGRTIVFSGDDGSGLHLWVRELGEPDARMLDDTEGGLQPAMSPDGEWIAYVVGNRRIRKTRIGGGGSTAVAVFDDVTAALAWSADDEILLEVIGSSSGIHRVSANGGTPEPLIPLDTAANERSQRRPFVLRDEGLVLYTSRTDDGRTGLAVFSLDDGRRGRLDVDGVQALGVIDDHLIYSRNDGALMAVPFDARGMRTRGPARQLADLVSRSATGTAVALSESGTLVYQPPASPMSQLMLGKTAADARQLGDWVRAFRSPRFSPDGRRVAVGIAERDGQDLWIVDRVSAEATQVTRSGAAQLADWTPDGTALIYGRGAQLWTVPVDGSRGPRRLVEVDGRVSDASLLPDGRSLVVSRRGAGQGWGEELVRVSLEGAVEGEPVVASLGAGGTLRPIEPRVSPDGKWVAFLDRNEQEVHLRSLDGAGGVQVSDSGGFLPVWGHDSRRLFYHSSAGLMVVELQTEPTIAVLRRRLVEAFPFVVHDLSPDGEDFLILRTLDAQPGAVVAFDWVEDLRRELGARNE